MTFELAQRLQGNRAVITGGAKGIGAAIVQRLTAEGVSVVLCDIDASAGTHIADETGAIFVKLDVTDYQALEQMHKAHGPFDIVINNAGIDQHAFFTQTTPDDWSRLLAVNLEATLALTHIALPAMQAAGYGRIINIASEAARLGSKGGAIYAAAKGGVVAFTKSIARENARFGITANIITPGPVRTPLLMQAVSSGGDKLLEAMKQATLVERLGEPEDVAAATAFLASREAGFITGETLGVSGGMGLG